MDVEQVSFAPVVENVCKLEPTESAVAMAVDEIEAMDELEAAVAKQAQEVATAAEVFWGRGVVE